MEYTEGLTVEFKREYVEDIKKTVIAFANTSGGRIFIGIEDDGSIVGVKDIDDTILKISSGVRNAIRPDITMFVSYNAEKVDGKSIVIVEVQKGTACPYYIENKGIRPGGVYVRHGSSSVPATETAIIKMIKETDGNKYEELRSTNQELTFEYADHEFEHAEIKFSDFQKKTLHLISNDGIYTNLALLLSDQCVHTIKAAVFDGKEKMNFKDRCEFTGSLLKQINDAYDYINRYNKTRSEFKNIHRIDIREYPVQAIREALINAVVHRDYAFSGSILISIFDDRIEFVSIGGLVKGISYDDMLLGVSIQRNENLANVFYRLSLIEAFGTGVPKMMRCYHDCLVKPEIIVTDNAFKIILPSTNSTKTGADEISDDEEKIMSFIAEHKSIKRNDVETLLVISRAAAARILKKLVSKNKLEKRGNSRNLVYVMK